MTGVERPLAPAGGTQHARPLLYSSSDQPMGALCSAQTGLSDSSCPAALWELSVARGSQALQSPTLSSAVHPGQGLSWDEVMPPMGTASTHQILEFLPVLGAENRGVGG